MTSLIAAILVPLLAVAAFVLVDHHWSPDERRRRRYQAMRIAQPPPKLSIFVRVDDQATAKLNTIGDRLERLR